MKFTLKMIGLLLLGGVVKSLAKLFFEWIGLSEWDNGYFTGFVMMAYLGGVAVPIFMKTIDVWLKIKR